MKLSVIIVHYNVAKFLKNCLLSLDKYLVEIPHEIIVIDNSSTDPEWKSIQADFPHVIFIESAENLGFSKANNAAVLQARGEFLLILNPDTELEGFYMKDIIHFAENQKKLGCLGVRMHDAKGNFLPESKRSVPNMYNSFEKLFAGFRMKKNHRYYRDDISEESISEIEVITGAFLLIKRDIYNKIGGFDEKYFMYGEDIDLCYTLLQKGFHNYYYGKASILHHKGESTVKDDIYLERFYGAMQIFIDKYYKDSNPIQYSFLKTGLKLRHQIARIKNK